MKKVIVLLITVSSYFTASSQINTDTVPNIYGAKRLAVLSSSALVSKQDSTAGAGLALYATPFYVKSQLTSGTVNSLAVTAPLNNSGTTTNPVVNITQSNTTTNGYLSSTDWNTFNNKISANQTITFTASGDATGTATGATALSPTLTLASVGTTGTYAYPTSVTTDSKGRTTAIVSGNQPFTSSGVSNFVATANQTSFSVTNMPSTVSQVTVSRNGIVLQSTRDFTTAPGTLTIVTTTIGTLAAGDNIIVKWFNY